MKPNFEPGKWFMQCVGIDIAKGTFTACLCMYEFDCDALTAPVVFNNDRLVPTSSSNGAVKRL